VFEALLPTSQLDMDWIHPRIGLDRMTVTPVSNKSSLQRSFFQIMIYECLIIPVHPQLKRVRVTTVGPNWNIVYDLDFLPDIYGLDWM